MSRSGETEAKEPPASSEDGPPESLLAELRALPARYPQKRGALLPLLHALQAWRGHLTPADMKLAGELTGVAAADVFSVVTFYTMYRQRPVGRFPIGVCRNIACWVNGSEQIVSTVKAELGIAPGERTADGRFSLEEVECLGSCGTGPCLEIESRYFENLTPDKVRALIEKLRRDDRSPSEAILAAQREFPAAREARS
ncbi:MAG: NAD(P)H-dependent oxidoreductase subunit E [Planctomycetes bacterium]|nr:NAD(P)H-dependent oxidoreductase subunit E [Planctomycetota bacterium]